MKEELYESIDERVFWWFGHIARMENMYGKLSSGLTTKRVDKIDSMRKMKLGYKAHRAECCREVGMGGKSQMKSNLIAT